MTKGIKFAFLAAVISGISVYANGLMVSKGSPVYFVLVRNIAVSIALSIMLLITGRVKRFREFNKKDWLGLMLVGLIGGGLPFGLFFFGLSRLGGLGANLINKSLFLWVAVLAVPLLKERLSRISLTGYGFILYAIYGAAKLPVFSVFSLSVLGATILWAAEHVLAKRILRERITPWELSWARITFGLPVLLIFYLLIQKNPVTEINGLLIPVSVSSLFLIFYMSSWYTAIKYAPVSMVSSVLVLAPVVTIILESLAGHSFPQTHLLADHGMLVGGILLIVSYHLFRNRSRNLLYEHK